PQTLAAGRGRDTKASPVPPLLLADPFGLARVVFGRLEDLRMHGAGDLDHAPRLIPKVGAVKPLLLALRLLGPVNFPSAIQAESEELPGGLALERGGWL